jgi:hypothetical protein
MEGQMKVQEEWLGIVRQQHIGWLEIEMDKAPLVSVLKAIASRPVNHTPQCLGD